MAPSRVIEMCRALFTARGEASGVALAAEILRRYRALDVSERAAFFQTLADEFGPDRERVREAIANFGSMSDEAAASEIHFASEPRRHELFRRLNRAPGATAALVEMRADMLALINQNPSLAVVDRDFLHLFASWFNRGFLILRRIDWSSPATVLEKIIRYEAVHEIGDWDELRRRIGLADRRCYAFFHPRLVDEPLIFVEVALTPAAPTAIAPLLAPGRAHVSPEKARVARRKGQSRKVTAGKSLYFPRRGHRRHTQRRRKQPHMRGCSPPTHFGAQPHLALAACRRHAEIPCWPSPSRANRS